MPRTSLFAAALICPSLLFLGCKATTEASTQDESDLQALMTATETDPSTDQAPGQWVFGQDRSDWSTISTGPDDIELTPRGQAIGLPLKLDGLPDPSTPQDFETRAACALNPYQ